MGRPDQPVDATIDLERVRRVHRPRIVASGIAITLLVIAVVAIAWVAALVVATEPAERALELPAPGSASGQFLADGTPVWVTHTTGGQVFVLATTHPDSPGGMHTSAAQVLLCDEPVLVSLWWSQFQADGTRFGGPARDDLIQYEIVDIHDGRITVGTPRSPAERAVLPQADEGRSSRYRHCPADPIAVPHPGWYRLDD